MTRLEKFYKYGLSQVGWNKYSYVNIEFDNQIICKRKDERPNVYEPQPVQSVVNISNPTSQIAEDGPSEGEETTPATENKTGTENKKMETNKKSGNESKKTDTTKKKSSN